MKLIKTLALSLILSTVVITATASNKLITIAKAVTTPDKTICIKNPNAADADKFFSTITTLNFEIYKPGSVEFVNSVVETLRKNPTIASVTIGKVTGDFHAITIVLKSANSKEFFVGNFKRAGLFNIKINNNDAVSLDKI
jgi:hypothetical protein